MPDELLTFLDRGDPPIVFTLGSSAVGAAGDFYRESVAAAASLGARAVLLVGHDPANHPRDPLPRGVIAIESAPHQELFPRAAAIVHQGGVGTTGQAMRSGRPMLVVPHAHDQPDNAFRVTRLGAARVLRPGRYTRVAGRGSHSRAPDRPGVRAPGIADWGSRRRGERDRAGRRGDRSLWRFRGPA